MSYEYDPACWLKGVAGGRSIASLTMPGTHDSCAGLFKPYSQCQTMTLKEQFNKGIRFVDIRCRHINNSFAIHHGPFYFKINFDGVLRECVDFLCKNPSEFIIVSVKEEYNTGGCTRAFEGTLLEYIEKSGGNFYLEREIPDVDEARGKIVLFSRHGGNTVGLDASEWPDNTSFDTRQLAVQDKYKLPLTRYDKWDIVKDFLLRADNDKASGLLYLNFCSATNISWMEAPKLIARKTNRRLYEYCEKQKNKKYGIIILDFPELPHTELVEVLINLNF